jgi:hypothetical protein
MSKQGSTKGLDESLTRLNALLEAFETNAQPVSSNSLYCEAWGLWIGLPNVLSLRRNF